MERTHGDPGRAWVIGQGLLFAAIFFAPFTTPGDAPTWLAVAAGLLVGVLGVLVTLLGIVQLGRSLTVFPRPLDDAQLVETGIYAIVRHPIYTGVVLAALGWSIVTWSALALLLTAVLGVFFDRKAAYEETMLRAKYARYTAYSARVHKLIPWVY